MGREKRNPPAAVAGGPKERHKRVQRSQYDPKAPVPEGFVAKPSLPKSKHHSYFEFVENKDKKKKLEYQVTYTKTPPPGFEFVPIGNPELTTACKELSRERDAMIFIVSNSKEAESSNLAHHVHRIGHHIREIIVDEARSTLGQPSDPVVPAVGGSPEPIPESQEEYNAQVDAAVRDLFPRIPNTDRQMIIEHAFRRGTTFKGEKPVGLSADITLARRVQLAVLAHIRHTHTRYDDLLKETTWQNARKVVEKLCLDTLVKWRGDEETGRDQLDEILREVVVISDSEDDDSDQETDGSSIEENEPRPETNLPLRTENGYGQAGPGRWRSPKAANIQNQNGPLTPAKLKSKVKKHKRKTSAEKKGQRGFKRYNAWQEALQRYREGQSPEFQPSILDRPPNYPLSRQITPRPVASYAPHQFPEPAELRIPSNGAGPAPNENGYVAQPSPFKAHLVDSVRRSYSPLPRPLVHDKVMSPREVREVHRDPSTIHRPVSMVTNRLQDMLVPSIEPNSPEAMRPAFIRPVPPRGQDFRNNSPIGSNMQYSPRRLSPSRGAIFRDDSIFPIRRSIQRDRVAPTEGYDDRGRQIPNIAREQEFISPRDGFPIYDSPVYRSVGRPIESAPLRPVAVTQRSAPEVSRPGDRSNPILMEDRGGFYERVSTHPDGAHPLPRTTNIVEFRQASHEARRPQDHHRVVPRQEGPRYIVRRSRGDGMIAEPPTVLYNNPQSEPALAEPVVIWPGVRREVDTGGLVVAHYPASSRRREPAPQSMMPDHVVRHQEPYGVIQHNERPPSVPQHEQPIRPHYRNEAPTVTNQRNSGRGFPLPPHQPENIIVLE